MAGRPIEAYVTQQILEQGGFEALIERIRHGESVAMMARMLWRPDGHAIDRTTLSHMLHRLDDRSAQVAAARKEWRTRPRQERLATRKRLRATAPQRAMRAMGLMHEPPALVVVPQAISALQERRRAPLPSSPARSAAIATPLARRPLVVASSQPPAVIPTPKPDPPPKREGVEWDEYRPYCHTCSRGDCLHVKREYMRRAERYKSEHPPVVARFRGLV
jgi:hypothetical protein